MPKTTSTKPTNPSTSCTGTLRTTGCFKLEGYKNRRRSQKTRKSSQPSSQVLSPKLPNLLINQLSKLDSRLRGVQLRQNNWREVRFSIQERCPTIAWLLQSSLQMLPSNNKSMKHHTTDSPRTIQSSHPTTFRFQSLLCHRNNQACLSI